MSFRPARAAKLGLFVLLAQILLGLPVGPISVASAKGDPSIGKTGLVLPTRADPAGRADRAPAEPTFQSPDPQQETGPELPDGTYRLPPNYVENPDYEAPPASGGKSYTAKKDERTSRRSPDRKST